MSSRELTAWFALFRVRAAEQADLAKHRRDVIESGDGQVIVHGRPEGDEEDDEEDGEPE